MSPPLPFASSEVERPWRYVSRLHGFTVKFTLSGNFLKLPVEGLDTNG